MVIIIIGGFTLLPIIYLTAERWRGERYLNQRLAALRAHHEVLSVDELAPKRVPPDQNIMTVIKEIKEENLRLPVGLDTITAWLYTTPGRAFPTWKGSVIRVDPQNTEDWEKLEECQHNRAKLLETVRTALARPGFDSNPNYNQGVFVKYTSDLYRFRMCTYALVPDFTLAMHQGNTELAHRDLLLLIRACTVQREPDEIVQYHRMACFSMASDTTWAALQWPGWTEAQLAALQNAWKGCDFETDMIRALEMERAKTILTFQLLKGKPDSFQQYLEVLDNWYDMSRRGNPSRRKWIIRNVNRPLWNFAWAGLDESIQLDRIQSEIDFTRFLQTNSLAAQHSFVPTDNLATLIPKYTDTIPFHIRVRFVVSPFILTLPENTFKKTLRTQTQYEMTQTAIALARCKLRDGAYPPSLDRLVPEYLPALPRDRMDGKTLRYRPLPNGTYVLYSVGEDFKDDGGSTGVLTQLGHSYNLWRGPDVVWPALGDESEFPKPKPKQMSERRRRGNGASAPTPR
jgi:hypothetical protein